MNEPKEAQNYPYTVLTNIESVYKGNVIIIQNHPAIIIDITKSMSGKHGYSKFLIKAKDIDTDQIYENVYSTNSNVESIVPIKYEYELLKIDKETDTCRIGNSSIFKNGITLPNNITGKIIKDYFYQGFKILLNVSCYLDRYFVINDYKIA
ncbi:translation elongation factor eIF5A [Fadolivirus algeromassiliense]|jgi:hypothetical protein|uniref:Translation elongation factor eIF5A n=1 Tax=Fadolivirus FV1/VV64 TaxID=3070911 RepID=A0A7D3QVE7_9VIRU|nr:translation elongation factor eIF5A [Fadolivirus algeromassiliense]QKF93766.1 translation elongation factor eIF5A [Fadolivirus FV1/VV64]